MHRHMHTCVQTCVSKAGTLLRSSETKGPKASDPPTQAGKVLTAELKSKRFPLDLRPSTWDCSQGLLSDPGSPPCVWTGAI